jgi:hypothetical protein
VKTGQFLSLSSADAIIDQLATLPSTAVQTIAHDNGGHVLSDAPGCLIVENV